MEAVKFTENEKKQLHRIQIELLNEVDRICSQNQIKYCIAFGTMLGAIRHCGFIPWDDDADIMMLREDYEKFKRVCEIELGSKFFFQDQETDKEYLWGHGKLRNINTTYVRLGQEHIKCQTGVFIDIFPLDNIPKTLVGKIVHDWICYALRKVLWSKVGKLEEKKFLKRVIFNCLSIIPKKIIYKIIGQINYINRNNIDGDVRGFLHFTPGRGTKQSIKKRYGYSREWFTDRKQYKFEGKYFWGPKDYDTYLKYIYGDYMVLPPEDQREDHSPVSFFDFAEEGLSIE